MVKIEKYQASMAVELLEVYFTAIRMVCIQDYSQDQVMAWAPDTLDFTEFKQKMFEIQPFVALLGSTIIGYADLQADGLIDHFYVHGEYQRRGAGRALMQTILRAGDAMPQLHSYVSLTAKSFYLHYGFSVEHVQQVDIRGCALENMLMTRQRRP